MQRSTFLAGVVGGLVAATVVAVVLLATGLAGDERADETAPVQANAGASAEAEPSVREIFGRARGAIVRVDARRPGTPIPRGRPTRDDDVATGTGFVIGRDGSIATNQHVVAGGPLVTVQFRSGQKRLRARVVGRDASTDLALLKIRPPKRMAVLPLGDSRKVRVGDPAIALGNPFGLERTLTLGVVSAVDREIRAPNGAALRRTVQFDAAIAPGSSGGPLLDASGRVIGVNSQSRGSGLGFAVSVNTLKEVVPQLRRHGRVRRAYLGVSLRDGNVVSEVVRGGPADEAGVRRGDRIVSVAGSRDVVAAVAERSPGDEVELVVRRGGRRVELTAELEERR